MPTPSCTVCLWLALLGGLPSLTSQTQSDQFVEQRFQRAKAAERAGEYDSAADHYRAILAVRPNSPEVLTNLGLVRYLQANNGEAIDAFERALRMKPDLLAANLFLGLTYARTNQFEKSIPPLRKAAALNPDEFRTYSNLGRSYLELNRDEEALEAVRNAARLAPDDPDVLYNLGRVHTKMMIAAYRRLAEADPSSYRVDQILGESYEARGDYKGAIESYRAAIAKAPRGPDLHYSLANVYWKLGQWDQAEAEFKQELEISPGDYLSLWKLGNIRLARNDPGNAILYLQQALKQKPDLAQAHRDMGKALSEQGSLDAAIVHFRKAAELSPEEDSVHYRLAMIYRKLGKLVAERAELDLFEKLSKVRREKARTPPLARSSDDPGDKITEGETGNGSPR